MIFEFDDRYALSGTTFSVRSPRHIIYGRGAASQFIESYEQLVSADSSQPVLVVTDEFLLESGIARVATEALEAANFEVDVCARRPEEPTAGSVNEIAEYAVRLNPSGIVAIGGGATMDTAKSVRILHQFGGRIEDYEGLDKVPAPAVLPLAAVATTSGTGSETGYAALYTDQTTATKRFVGSPYMVPDIAVVDPDMTLSVPPATTANTGIDALAQAMGPYLSPLRHPITDVLALEAVQLLGRNLLAAYRDGTDVAARSAMAYGSLMMGLAMNNAECIGEHFFAEIVGPRYEIAHGVSVGMFLPYILQFNRTTSVSRLARLAGVLLSDPSDDEREATDQLIGFVSDLLGEVGIPSMRDIGVVSADLDDLTTQVFGHIGIELGLNPRPMTRSDCSSILQAAFDGVPALELSI